MLAHVGLAAGDGNDAVRRDRIPHARIEVAGRRKGLVGPWGHTYPYTAAPQGLAWAHEELRWWAHWLNGEATGIMDEPMLRAFMPYATAAEAPNRRIC